MLYHTHVLSLQQKLLGDAVRNDAFHAALRASIRKDESVVIDVGSGTGFLSFLAERLGAKECWLVESGEVAALSETIAKDNGMERCRFVHAHSGDVPLPAADVIVSETLGNYALEEGIISTMNGARTQLRDGGVMIPASLNQFACPVITDRLQRDIDVWDVGYGLDMGAARAISLQNMYVKKLATADLLDGGAAAKRWDHVDFYAENDDVREATVEWAPGKGVTVHGIALWWESTLSEGIVLSTSPLEKPTHWDQIYLPLLEPVSLAASETLRVTLRSDTRPEVVVRLRWKTDVENGGAIRSSQESDTDVGLL